ncbi:hypothetical protein [Frankia sp. Cas4]|uniref:hypothetical protein n=1 Tax=Frankia sp. Cas4 TaxID=3073927 RepID=UPI002AD2249C|nr:hypothetical protein [Frankia sp. Cas4]
MDITATTFSQNPLMQLDVHDALGFRNGVVALGQRLIDRGLVDYTASRAASHDLTVIPPEVWAEHPEPISRRDDRPITRHHLRLGGSIRRWTIDDPSGRPTPEVREIRREIDLHVQLLFTELLLSSNRL